MMHQLRETGTFSVSMVNTDQKSQHNQLSLIKIYFKGLNNSPAQVLVLYSATNVSTVLRIL